MTLHPRHAALLAQLIAADAGSGAPLNWRRITGDHDTVGIRTLLAVGAIEACGIRDVKLTPLARPLLRGERLRQWRARQERMRILATELGMRVL